MRGRATLAVAVIGAFLGWTTPAYAECADADLGAAESDPSRMAAALFCLHNEVRAAEGLETFRWSTLLAESAGSHSSDMVARSYFDHESPEGVTPSERMEQTGYGDDRMHWRSAENIAWATGSQATPRSIMDGWMKSKDHRENILEPELRDIGFGIVLGSPRSPSPPNAVTYTTNFGVRDVPDDSTVLTAPGGEPVAPPEPETPTTQDTPTEEPPAEGGDPEPVASPEPVEGAAPEKPQAKRKKKLRRCLRKARAAKGKKARKKARRACQRKRGKARRLRSRNSPAT